MFSKLENIKKQKHLHKGSQTFGPLLLQMLQSLFTRCVCSAQMIGVVSVSQLPVSLFICCISQTYEFVSLCLLHRLHFKGAFFGRDRSSKMSKNAVQMVSSPGCETQQVSVSEDQSNKDIDKWLTSARSFSAHLNWIK